MCCGEGIKRNRMIIMRKTAQAILMKGVILLMTVAILLCCITGCSKTPDGSDSVESKPTIVVDDESQIDIQEPEEASWKIERIFLSEEDSQTFLFGPDGSKWEIHHAYGNDVVEYNDTRCILRLENHPDGGPVSLWAAQVGREELFLLSADQYVIDYTVAYDTLYWYNTNREVWSCPWEDDTPRASLYCEDALGVSPYTDEGEGAIVSPDRANWDGYGLPIYSPYGK